MHKIVWEELWPKKITLIYEVLASRRTDRKGTRSATYNNRASGLTFVTEDFEGVLPATAGATASPPGLLCCSVGNESGKLPLGDGESGISLPLRSS